MEPKDLKENNAELPSNSLSLGRLKHGPCFMLGFLFAQLMVELHQQLLGKLQSCAVDTSIVEYLQQWKQVDLQEHIIDNETNRSNAVSTITAHHFCLVGKFLSLFDSFGDALHEWVIC